MSYQTPSESARHSMCMLRMSLVLPLITPFFQILLCGGVMKRFVLSVVVVILIVLVFAIVHETAFAQTISVSGTVSDKEGNSLAGVKIAIKGTVAGTISNTKGKFALTTSVAPPFKLVFSIIGFTSKEVPVAASTDDLKIQLDEKAIRGEDIVVSASRVPENVMQSPVTIEKVEVVLKVS